jgi:RNA polymerase sigma-70 factor (ECF subfamily)
VHLARILEDLVRGESGRRVLAGLIRLTDDFDAAEDALQEACARALEVWRRDRIPDAPGAWLNTVARRIAIDRLRRRRETVDPSKLELAAPEAGETEVHEVEDDRLRLLFVCCHPALEPRARAALALRTLGGLSTREIARAFVEPEATTAQRLVRAKKKIREARIPFEVPRRERLPERVDTLLEVLYLMFNEGYAATEGASLLRVDLCAEAIRLARLTSHLLPQAEEAQGLLALMLLTDARRPARFGPDGELVPLEEQDRSLWIRERIEEGERLVDGALARRSPGPYQIQAAIAALHSTAASASETDWNQIHALYRALLELAPNPVIELNAAVAAGMAGDLRCALASIEAIEAAGALRGYHLLPAARAELLRRSARNDEAANAYREALALVRNEAERRYLERRIRELGLAAMNA